MVAPPSDAKPGNGKNWYVQLFKDLGCPVMVALLLIAWDVGWLPSASRETLPIVRAIKTDTTTMAATQDRFKDQILAELRALRRRQAALCLVMLSTFATAPKDKESIRDACLVEAIHGTP